MHSHDPTLVHVLNKRKQTTRSLFPEKLQKEASPPVQQRDTNKQTENEICNGQFQDQGPNSNFDIFLIVLQKCERPVELLVLQVIKLH